MRYKLEITLRSAASTGSGEGWAGTIDSDIVFDRHGLPYIPARRIKGILRDMAEDVVNAHQMCRGETAAAFERADIIRLFGDRGWEHAAPLAVDNAYLQDQNAITPWLEWAKEIMPEAATADRVISTFTHVRTQTAINNRSETAWLAPATNSTDNESLGADGVADEGSLRMTRVLNSGYTFVSDVTINADDDKYRHLLALAVQTTRSLGGKRNRGLGQVQCRLLDAASNENVIPEALRYLQNKLTAAADPNNSPASKSEAIQNDLLPADNQPASDLGLTDNATAAAMKQLNYTIRLKAPVLITSSVGDENIAMSEDYISGTSLLGFFANLYIKTEKPSQPHADSRFKSWFLSDNLRFLNGYKVCERIGGPGLRSLPIPKSIQFKKTAEETGSEKPFEKLFPQTGQEQEETKHREGYCTLKSCNFEKVTTEKHHNFHHQRTDQIKARSDEGEIFNYEHLTAGQEFMAAVIGKETALNNFEDWLAKKIFAEGKRILPGRLGRSKNTQYGLVEIDFAGQSLQEPAEVDTEAQFDVFDENQPQITLTLLSHAIVLNEHGQAAVELKWLKKALGEVLNKKLNALKSGFSIADGEIDIENSFVRATGIENYVAVWKARKPSLFAFEMSSCFLIKINRAFSAKEFDHLKTALQSLQRDGLGIRRNEGFGRIAINWQRQGSLDNVTEERKNIRKASLRNKPEGALPVIAKNIFATALQDYVTQKVRKFAVEKLAAFPAALSGAQISRLQRFAETCRDEAHFQELLDALAKTAREGLEKIKSPQMTLLEFLQSDHLATATGKLYGQIKIVVDNQQRFIEATGYEPLANEKKAGWFRLYMTTFFAMMRKKAKLEKATHEQN